MSKERYKVWSGGKGRYFNSYADASAFAYKIFKLTGDVVAITECKSRKKVKKE